MTDWLILLYDRLNDWQTGWLTVNEQYLICRGAVTLTCHLSLITCILTHINATHQLCLFSKENGKMYYKVTFYFSKKKISYSSLTNCLKIIEFLIAHCLNVLEFVIVYKLKWIEFILVYFQQNSWIYNCTWVCNVVTKSWYKLSKPELMHWGNVIMQCRQSERNKNNIYYIIYSHKPLIINSRTLCM